jgi:hypothetical protein
MVLELNPLVLYQLHALSKYVSALHFKMCLRLLYSAKTEYLNPIVSLCILLFNDFIHLLLAPSSQN